MRYMLLGLLLVIATTSNGVRLESPCSKAYDLGYVYGKHIQYCYTLKQEAERLKDAIEDFKKGGFEESVDFFCDLLEKVQRMRSKEECEE